MKSVILLLLSFYFVSFASQATVNDDLLNYVNKNYEDDLIELLQNNSEININYQDSDGFTALHSAIYFNRPKMVEILMNSYPYSSLINYNLENRFGETPLLVAIAKCSDCISLLLKERNKINFEAGNMTALVSATKNKNDNLGALLISLGANTNAIVTDSDGVSHPYLEFLIHRNLPKTLEAFLAVNKNINQRFSNKQTPLMIAASNGNISQVRLLIKNSAAINLRDINGNTALHFAANTYSFFSKDHDLYDLLIQSGSKADFLNNKNLTAESILNQRIKYFENQKKLIDLLSVRSLEKVSLQNSSLGLVLTTENRIFVVDFDKIEGHSFEKANLLYTNGVKFKFNSLDEFNSVQSLINDLVNNYPNNLL